MRIGINLLYLIPGVVGGTETYARATLDQLLRQTHDEYVVFTNRNLSGESFPRAEVVDLGVDAHSRVRRYFTEQVVLPSAARKMRVDLIHSMGYVSVLRTDIPTVVTIHDVNFRHTQMPWSRRMLLRWLVSQSAKRADAIVTISEFSKREICEDFNVPPHKVWITPNAPSEDVFAPTPALEPAGDGPYVLALSSPSPHKNMRRLLEAFKQVKARFPEMRMVIAGNLPPSLPIPAELQGRVDVKGYVSRQTLLALYRSACCFVMPSLYEGFGIPLVEAMAMGVPVASSNQGALLEVGGDVPVYFDPRSIEQMSDALICLIDSRALRASQAVRGKERASAFRWDQSAAQLQRVYDTFRR